MNLSYKQNIICSKNYNSQKNIEKTFFLNRMIIYL